MVTLPGGQVAEFKPATEGTPGKTHLFSANEPPTPGQPSTLTTVTPEIPPIQGARKGTAPGMENRWFVPDQRNPGKFVEVVMGGGQAAPPAAPTPRSASKPAPKPETPSTTPVQATDDIPEVVTPAGSSNPLARQAQAGARRREEAASKDKAAKEARPKQRAVETFRAIASSPRMTAEDAPLIDEAMKTGMLTPAEMEKGRRILAKLRPQTAGYSRGGKVARYGLGG